MFKKFITKAVLFSTSGFLVIAESNLNLMCSGFLDEIKLPEELKDSSPLE